MSLVYRINREGNEIRVPESEIPYVMKADADPNLGKTLWLDYLRHSILGHDAILCSPKRIGDRDNELWIRRNKIVGLPNSMVFFNMTLPFFEREKASIEDYIVPDKGGLYEPDQLMPFTRSNFADIIFLSNCLDAEADWEVNMVATDKKWGRKSTISRINSP